MHIVDEWMDEEIVFSQQASEGTRFPRRIKNPITLSLSVFTVSSLLSYSPRSLRGKGAKRDPGSLASSFSPLLIPAYH